MTGEPAAKLPREALQPSVNLLNCTLQAYDVFRAP